MRYLAFFALLLAPVSAGAHQVGVSLGTYTVRADGIDVALVSATAEAAKLQDALPRLVITASALPCVPSAANTSSTENDGTRTTLHYACAVTPDTVVTIDAGFTQGLGTGHRHIADLVRGAHASQHVLFAAAPRLESKAGVPTSMPSFVGLFVMGIEHILGGFDHLTFLLALIVVDSRLRSLLKIVTAFTLAHSVSLALATLGWLAPPAAIIEPAIAASIIYVGVESLRRPATEHRWVLALAFGFIHGFGFAGALTDLALPRAQLPPALLAFNLGVEAGQLAVLAALVPALMLAKRWAWFVRYGVRSVSAAVIIAGAVWLVERLS